MIEQGNYNFKFFQVAKASIIDFFSYSCNNLCIWHYLDEYCEANKITIAMYMYIQV